MGTRYETSTFKLHKVMSEFVCSVVKSSLVVCLLIFVKHVLCRAPCFYLPVCFWFWVPANTWHWSLWLLLEPEKFHKKTIFCEIFIVVDPNVAFIVLFYWNWIRVFSKSSIFHVWSGNNLWIVKHLDFCLLEKSKLQSFQT